MIQLFNGDCLKQLKQFPDNHFDSIVTDPPYGISFMNKHWDYDVPKIEVWKECLRVLKPGGHALIACGTRTQHRMAVNIEDAGFEIRDVITWLYGSGFPKSTNVALRIDKESGAIGNRGKGFNAAGQGISLNQNKELRSDHPDYVPPEFKTDAAKQWQGWGTALKPACEFWTLARKPLSEKTVAANVQKWGTGGINIDGCRVEGHGADWVRDTRDQGPITKNAYGKYENILKNGSQNGRFPANLILDEEAAAMLGDPARFFYTAKASKSERNAGLEGMPEKAQGAYGKFKGDGRGRQTEHQPTSNHHPTVKPIKLMSYLCKLITPPNGIVLDPFTGSGSTGVAAKISGFKFCGIELNQEYFEIAKTRVEAAAPLI